MPIGFARSEFQQTPKGPHNAVCVDVIDLGLMPNKFKNNELQAKVEIRWQTEKKITKGPAAGKPYLIRKIYSNSRHPNSTVRKDLESWRGAAFTADELMKWNFETLIGKQCTLFVIHKVGEDGTPSARVDYVLPPDKNAKRLTPDYERAESRQSYQAAESDSADSDTEEPPMEEGGFDTDEEVPF